MMAFRGVNDGGSPVRDMEHCLSPFELAVSLRGEHATPNSDSVLPSNVRLLCIKVPSIELGITEIEIVTGE